MGKGDRQAVQSKIDTQYPIAQNRLNDQFNRNQSMYNTMYQNYNTGTSQNLPDYSNIMNSYRSFLNGGPVSVSAPSRAISPTQYSSMVPATTPNTGLRAELFGGRLPDLPDPSGRMVPAGSSMNSGDIVSKMQALVGGDYSAAHLHEILPQLQAMGINVQNQDAVVPGVRDLRPRFTLPDGTTWDMGDQGWVNRGNMSGGGDSSMSGGAGFNSPLGAWQAFSESGGFSPQDIQNLRARAIAPTRAIYQNAQDELARQKNLSGGYMPNYGAASAKLARDMSNQISDTNVNADAAIAQMVQQGKLYGLQGLTNAQLGALNAMTGLYGTTPALANTFGNQVLQSANQGNNLAGQQLDFANNITNAQIARAGVPGWLQSTFGSGGWGRGMIDSAGTLARL